MSVVAENTRDPQREAENAARMRVLEGMLNERDIPGYVRGWLTADRRLSAQ